jgi:hypothetical protein
VVPVLIAAPIGAIGGGLAALAGVAVFQLWSEGGLLMKVDAAAKVQATMLAALGAGIGLGVGLASKSIRTAAKSLFAGAVGGGLTGILYPVVASFVLPTVGTEHLVPRGGPNRLLWIELTTALLACIILAAGREPAKPSAPPKDK